jgi:hypothetical protein
MVQPVFSAVVVAHATPARDCEKGEILLFTPKTTSSFGMASPQETNSQDVEFSSSRPALGLRMRYDCP